MAVSKKLRFEVFRRDRFLCRYCGRSAMDGAYLEPDHVVPRAAGGKDVASNLLTACEACNSGKRDTLLDAPFVEDVPKHLIGGAENEDEGSPWDTDVPDWVEGVQVSAAVAWSNNWMPGQSGFAYHGMSVDLAIASGRTEEEIVAACEAARIAQDPDIAKYLTIPKDPYEGEFETAAYLDALNTLAGFVPGERRQLIWLARSAAGDYTPTSRELIRASASISKRLLEEHGREYATLRHYLRWVCPNGSEFLCRATAEWDGANQGRAGHAAWECRDEVLEIAVGLALNAEVPA